MMTVELHAKIRHLHANLEWSGRQIAKELGISRNTVAKALEENQAPKYQLKQPRPAPKLEQFKSRLEQLLIENRSLPKKQRYTHHKLYELLLAEGYSGSASSVNTFAVGWKKRNKAPKVFLPLEFLPGRDGQVDWGEAQVMIGGVLQTIQLFVMWLAYSHRLFVRAYPSQKQESFFEGHVFAFQFFGGVPHRLSYDNLSTAVKILAEGRIREENRAFIAFRSYYLFDSHFCTPAQGHEKGGVEGSVGFSRRNFLAGVPQFNSFEELNQYLAERCRANDGRTVRGQTESIGQMGQTERGYLRPLPLHGFECCVTKTASLNGYSQLTFETNKYSVPAELARQQLVIKAYPFQLKIYDEQKLLATHPRSYGREQEIFDPLHYLSLLEIRPGAFEYAKPLKQWKRDWSPTYYQLLAELKAKQAESSAVREFVRILALHKLHPVQLVEQAVAQALHYGCIHFEGVRQCLHQITTPSLPAHIMDLSERPNLAEVARHLPDTRCYEQLLERQG
jgi:transposase